MKKILIFLFFVSSVAFAQPRLVSSISVASNGTAFGRNMPVGTIINDATTGKAYLVLLGQASTQTIAGCTDEVDIRELTHNGLYIKNQNASAQTANLWINGVGTFGGNITSSTLSGTGTRLATADANGTLSAPANPTITGILTAGSFVKSGGTSSQYLLADGSTTSVAGSVYKGELNGSTGVPTAGGSALVDGTGTAGWYYACATAGTRNYGSGNITLAVGDQLYYNGTIWLKIPGAGSYTLPVATGSTLGGVKSSASVSVDGSGVMSVSTSYEAPLTFSTGLNRTGNTITNTITNNNQLTNGAGYITGYSETDPTIYAWAKAATKPSYTFSEIGSKPTTLSGYGITDATSNARSAISLTTTGTSGASTYSSATGVLNIPQYSGGSMVYPGAGIPISTGSAWSTSITNNSTNWDKYNQWDGGATGLTAATGRTSLGLGTAATSASTDFATASHTHSTYVPYTGATGNVTLGTYTITGGNFILNSDRRLKTDIKPLIKWLNLTYYQYRMKSDPAQLRYGVIAQEVEKTNPELVRTGMDGVKSVAYIDLLIAKIAELEQRIKALENEK